MAGGGSKKKEKCQSPSMKAPPLQPDQVMALGYHDLAEYHCSLDEFSEAYNILKSACLMHDSSPFLHYWRADVSLQYAYCFRFSTDLDKLRDILDEARGAAHRAATMSPCDIEFRRFYISILSEMGFFNEAIRECKQVLSIREDMLFLHFDSQKEQILEKIRHLYNMMEENLDNLGKLLLPMSRNRYLHYSGIKGKRSKSIEINKHMEENDQKRWRKSCWDSMNDEVKAEFLAVKYEDLRTFFLDAPGKIGLTPLLDVFSSAILGIHMRSWECYSCDSEFRDYHSHMMHFEIHVPRMPKPLKDMLPEKKRTSLADIYTKTFLLLFDSAKLVLHMCNGVLLEESFVPGHLKHLLPDPDSFIAWLNVDVHCCKKKGDSKKILKELKELAYEVEELCFEKYLNLVVRKRAFVVAEHLCLEELKKKKHEKPSVKGILQAVENERISRDSSGMSIQIQSQIIVISDLLQNEPSLAKGTGVAKEAHVKILFKRRKELLANECDDINSKMNEKLACYNLKLIELSHACLFDNTTSFMPHLASFFKARLADYVYEHAIEQSEKNANMLISEEAKKNAISEGKPSICRTKKAKKKKRVSKVDKFLQNAHKQEGDLGMKLSCNSYSSGRWQLCLSGRNSN